MAEFSAVLVVLVPLALLGYTALYLLRLGMTAGELTEAARHRLAGLGMLLVYLVILACVIVLAHGLFCLLRAFKAA